MCHAYNALRFLDDLEAIPWLDEICNIFKQIVFMGDRPVSSFGSCFARHRNAKLQYGGGKRHAGSDYGDGVSMCVPLHGKDVNGYHRELNSARWETSQTDNSILCSTISGQGLEL